MKKIITLTITAAIAIIWLASNLFTTGVGRERDQFISQLVYNGLTHWHYSGKKVDDAFSEKAFKEFLDVLDTNKRFLLQKDIDDLKRYRYEIDDQFVAGSTEMMKLAVDRLKTRITEIQSFYPEMLEKPFDFSKDEYLELDGDKLNPCKDFEELKSRWLQTLKYQTLFQYSSLLKAEKKKDPQPALETKARQQVAKTMKNYFNRLQQTAANDALSLWLNAIAQVYDPHTTYFPPQDKETFDMEMSGKFEGIGAMLQEEDGFVKISSIIPGGPSWKQKGLQPGDSILKVAQGGQEPEDIVGFRVQEAVKLIRGKKGTTVNLTVKKPDNQVVTIPIVRDIVVIEETFAKSAVVSDAKTGKKYGYILLPKFYNDFNKQGGRNSTDDVRKELEKLKAKKIDGVILDLRNNSGGALDDAVRMSGLFFAKGPVVQVKDSQQGVSVLEDTDPATVYDGPLAVMVNVLSASASEILSAALQDYGRAVIIGSNQSFGKGTVQAMVNLDRFLTRRTPEDQSLGALTITIQKFYRVTGVSIQKKGVIPDVIFPDAFTALDLGEKNLSYPLDGDTIQTSSFTRWTSPPPDLKILAELSRERQKNDVHFTALNQYIERLKAIREDTRQSLQLSQVQAQEEISRKIREAFEKTQEAPLALDVASPENSKTGDNEELQKIRNQKQKDWYDAIRKDFQLKETMAVLDDMAGAVTLKKRR